MLSGLNAGNQASRATGGGPARSGFNAVRRERRKSGTRHPHRSDRHCRRFNAVRLERRKSGPPRAARIALTDGFNAVRLERRKSGRQARLSGNRDAGFNAVRLERRKSGADVERPYVVVYRLQCCPA